MIGAAPEVPVIADFRREIRRLHGCGSEFVRFVTLPESPGRARRVVALFSLKDHPARLCYAWLERDADRLNFLAVLHGVDVCGPEDAVRHVTTVERASRDRWAQEYA